MILGTTIVAVIFGVAWSRAEDVTVERRTLTRTLEIPEPVAALEGSDVELGAASMPAAGRVVLDIGQCELSVKPGPPGEPIRVDAKFDPDGYELSEHFNEGDEERGWTYEVEFQRTSMSSFVEGLSRLIRGASPRLVITLPPDVPYDLELDVSQGGGEIELGGLWLTNVDIEFMQGGAQVSFSDPLRYPTEKLRLEFSMGGGDVRRVGNASPRFVDIEIGMGGGDIDFRGEWQRDATISIDQSMGGASVRLPDDVEIRGLGRKGVETRSGEEIPRPVLTFNVSSKLGGLDIVE
jgi:hypothetical protein